MNENETGACRGMRLFFNPGYRRPTSGALFDLAQTRLDPVFGVALHRSAIPVTPTSPGEFSAAGSYSFILWTSFE
jgi:hypothetical protein